jgi:hypothetical protein
MRSFAQSWISRALLRRGAEWAATGQVTLPAPAAAALPAKSAALRPVR